MRSGPPVLRYVASAIYRLEAKANTLTLSIDSKVVVKAADNRLMSQGRVGLSSRLAQAVGIWPAGRAALGRKSGTPKSVLPWAIDSAARMAGAAVSIAR
jgi:hypothetical protein